MANNEIPEALRNEVADGMAISWDVPIEMDDGLVLRADVYKPIEEGQYPVIASYGPYAKNLSFQMGYPGQWERMCGEHASWFMVPVLPSL